MVYDYITRQVAKAIGFFAPGYARKYALEHQILRAYTAAKTTGPDRAFRPQQSSGAQEIVAAWQTIANKARDLDRNNPYVSGMKKRFVAAVVGEGSWPRPKIFKGDNKYDFNKELNTEVLRRWEIYADDACANGDNIYQLQRIAARHFFVDGAFLIRKMIKGGQLLLEGLEIDHLDTTKDVDDGIKRIVGGIELDKYNKPIAYHIMPRHPAEIATLSIREPAENVIHLFDRARASDINGVCSFASVVTNLYSIGEYRTATMNLARVATGFGVFVE
jgi:capsid protein